MRRYLDDMDPEEALSEGYMCLEDFPIPSEWRWSRKENDRIQEEMEKKSAEWSKNNPPPDPKEIIF